MKRGCGLIGVLLLLPLLGFGSRTRYRGQLAHAGADPGGTRYSPLTQITPANVNQLKVAWVYHMRPAGSTSLHPSEDQPLVVGPTMYVVTPYSRVVALDAATGHEQWVFQIPDGDQASVRGANYWPGGEGAGPAIIFGTRRGRMYSISAASGQLNADFGDHGMVDLKTPEVMTTGKDKSYILPTPPLIYKNLVITGSGPGEGPGGLNGGRDRPAILAPGMRAPANWSGPFTPCLAPAKWGMRRGQGIAGRIVPA